jgi:transcriptional regulator with XRE-family HTH domain
VTPSQLIRRARLEAGLTQVQLAKRLGTTQSAVARLERAKANVTVGTLDRALRETGHRLSLSALPRKSNVDRTLLARNLRLSPAERLASFETAHREVGELAHWRREHATAEFRPRALLELLADRGVDFVIIGGIAATLHGGSRNTFDLDICPAQDPVNLDALGRTLVELKAVLRGVNDDVPFVPDARTLEGMQGLTLDTSYGPLDLLMRPDGSPPYGMLRDHAQRIELGAGMVLVASIDDLIDMKVAADRDKDRLDLEELEDIKRQVR